MTSAKLQSFFYPLLLFAAISFACCSCAKTSATSPDPTPKSAEFSNSSQPAAAINPQAPSLFVVRQNGKFGYIDRKGNVVISAQFDAGKDFSEGLAAVAMSQGQEVIKGLDQRTEILRWGFIDETGKIVIPVKFSRVGKFSNGLVWAETGASNLKSDYGIDKHGYIDTTGKLAIAPRLAFIFEHGLDDGRADFTEGLAVVKVGRKYGYIDTSGRNAIPAKFDDADSFSEGVAAVQIGDKYGYIDRSGELTISPQFSWAGSFSEGKAVVITEEPYCHRFIDKTGAVSIVGPFTGASPFSEGLAVVEIDAAVKYIDKSGNTVITSQAKSGGPFVEGMAASVFSTGHRFIQGFIDKAGKEITDPTFQRVESFSGGLAKVYTSLRRFGYIDRTGEYVWVPSE